MIRNKVELEKLKDALENLNLYNEQFSSSVDEIYKIIDELYYSRFGASESESQLLAKYKEIRETLSEFYQLNHVHSKIIERAIGLIQRDVSDKTKPYD